MKKQRFIPGILIVATLLINACNQTTPKQATRDSIPTIRETPAQTVETENPVKEITGKVKEVVSGKDGYTAKVVAADGKVYAVTVSHANLKDPAQYKSVKAGDEITVKGDAWMMGEEEQITVRELR
jgi:hypothetical protein